MKNEITTRPNGTQYFLEFTILLNPSPNVSLPIVNIDLSHVENQIREMIRKEILNIGLSDAREDWEK